MGSFSDYLELKILEHIVGKVDFDVPTVWLALCTADPTDAGTGASCNEVPDSNSYARKATVAGDWNNAAAGAIDNANDLSFPEASGSWGTITHFALIDSVTHGAGNMLAHGAITPNKTIDSGDTAKFSAGDIDITLD